MISEIANKIEATFDTRKNHLLHLAAVDFLDMNKIGHHWVFWKKLRKDVETLPSTN